MKDRFVVELLIEKSRDCPHTRGELAAEIIGRLKHVFNPLLLDNPSVRFVGFTFRDEREEDGK